MSSEHSQMAEPGALGTEQRPVLPHTAECSTMGAETKCAPGCVPVRGSSSSSHLSVPAPFIPGFQKKRVAQGRCVLSPYKAWNEPMLAAGALGLPWHRCCWPWALYRGACPFSLGLAAKVAKTVESEARTERWVGCQTKQ